MNNEEKMGARNYAKYDRTFMMFGSIMNAMQGQLTEENWKKVASEVWNFCQKKVSDFVDGLYLEELSKKYERKEENLPFKE